MLARSGTATVIGMVSQGEMIAIPAETLILDDKRIQGSNMDSNRFRIDVRARSTCAWPTG